MINWKSIERLAKAHHMENRTETEESLGRFLKFWWCTHYNRPFKDPVLKEYTLDDLAYEFLRLLYLQPEHDPEIKATEERLKNEDEEWIKKQLEQTKKNTEINNKKKKRRSKKTSIPNLPDISTKFE
jgi:hypothetical protein